MSEPNIYAPNSTEDAGPYLKIGARVRIQMGDEKGNLGTIYNYLPSRPAPWHVRPDGWSIDDPGIAYQHDELDVVL